MTKIDIVSGFLGAGKTTLIKKMLAEAYKGEKLVLIENEFGDRDHTTVLHSLDKVEKQMRSDPAFAETVKQITTNINTNPG